MTQVTKGTFGTRLITLLLQTITHFITKATGCKYSSRNHGFHGSINLQNKSPVIKTGLLQYQMCCSAFFRSSFSRSVMEFNPIRIVEPLWSSADVAGARTPATPKAISSMLKEMMVR